MKATTSLFINKNSPNSKGECSITVRVTFQRKRRYFPTGINLTEVDFEKVMGERPRGELKKTALKLRAFEQKAYEIINELPVFDWTLFRKKYFTNSTPNLLVEDAFNAYISNLKKEERWSTASSYECARNSICSFKKDLNFQDITVDFLRAYEKNMLSQGKSKSTIGIYLRSFKAIINTAIEDGIVTKESYPFGIRKFSIPNSKNNKRALTKDQIHQIVRYNPESKIEEKYRDYWLFLYLSNGMNVKDMCLLKHSNIKSESIEYVRQKTKNTNSVEEKIEVYILKEIRNIINKWGTKKRDKDTYLFPELPNGLSTEIERKKIQQVTKNINKYISRIGNLLGFEDKLSSYWARHSFANILMNNGQSVEFISEALGHSSIKTTRSYLGSFASSKKAEAAKSLIDF